VTRRTRPAPTQAMSVRPSVPIGVSLRTRKAASKVENAVAGNAPGRLTQLAHRLHRPMRPRPAPRHEKICNRSAREIPAHRRAAPPARSAIAEMQQRADQHDDIAHYGAILQRLDVHSPKGNASRAQTGGNFTRMCSRAHQHDDAPLRTAVRFAPRSYRRWPPISSPAQSRAAQLQERHGRIGHDGRARAKRDGAAIRDRRPAANA